MALNKYIDLTETVLGIQGVQNREICDKRAFDFSAC